MAQKFDPSARPTYTPSQLQQIFDLIKLPPKYRSHPVIKDASAANTAAGLSFVRTLQKYFLANIPWENLDLHYSTHHTISLSPVHLFQKIVTDGRGRGGYCMENTCFFYTILLSLGYAIYPTGGRVNEACQPISAGRNWPGPRYDGWNHMVSILTIEGARYLVDVGFGSNSPTGPVPLTEGHTRVKVLPSNEELLTRDDIADNTSRNAEKMWIYHFRFSPDMPYLPAYCFSEIEFLPRDFETMNFFVSRSPKSWFTFHVVCLKFLLDEDSEEMVGDMTLFGADLRKRERGESSEALCAIGSERERVGALERFMGVRLIEEEREGIRGMVTCLE